MSPDTKERKKEKEDECRKKGNYPPMKILCVHENLVASSVQVLCIENSTVHNKFQLLLLKEVKLQNDYYTLACL